MYMFVLQACATGYYSSAGSCICLFYRLVQPVTLVLLVRVYVCSTGLCDRLLQFRWFLYMFVLHACATGYYSSTGSCICLFYRLVRPVTIVPLVHVHVYVCSTGLCDRLL